MPWPEIRRPKSAGSGHPLPTHVTFVASLPTFVASCYVRSFWALSYSATTRSVPCGSTGWMPRRDVFSAGSVARRGSCTATAGSTRRWRSHALGREHGSSLGSERGGEHEHGEFMESSMAFCSISLGSQQTFSEIEEIDMGSILK